jgi:hypothetical protein
MRGLQVCFGENRRAGRRGGLMVCGPRRGAVVPLYPTKGRSAARLGGVIRWRNLPSRLAILVDSFDTFRTKVSTTPARSITPSFEDTFWGFLPLAVLAYLPFWHIEIDFLVNLTTQTNGPAWPINKTLYKGGATC